MAVFGAGSFLFIFGGFALQIVMDAGRVKRKPQAAARIVRVRDTGSGAGGDLQMALDLIVQPKGGPEFEASVEIIVSRERADDYRAGKVVKVRYDSETEAVELV